MKPLAISKTQDKHQAHLLEFERVQCIPLDPPKCVEQRYYFRAVFRKGRLWRRRITFGLEASNETDAVREARRVTHAENSVPRRRWRMRYNDRFPFWGTFWFEAWCFLGNPLVIASIAMLAWLLLGPLWPDHNK